MSNIRTSSENPTRVAAASPPAIPQRSDSPFFSVSSDVTMSDFLEGDTAYQHDALYDAHHHHHHYDRRMHEGNEADDDDDDDDDSRHLNLSGSVMEYSDTSEEYTTTYIPSNPDGSTKQKKKKHRDRQERNGRSGNSSKYENHGKSSFRERTNLADSERVVRFSSESDACFDAEDIGNLSQDDVEKQRIKNSKKSRFKEQQLQPSDDGGKSNHSWVTQLAYSFRSPQVSSHKASNHRPMNSSSLEEFPHHQIQAAPSNQINKRSYPTYTPEIAYYPPAPPPYGPNALLTMPLHQNSSNSLAQTGEETPLLGTTYFPSVSSLGGMSGPFPPLRKSGSMRNSRRPKRVYRNENGEPPTLIILAAAFLQDYEANRPPTFAHVEDLTEVSRYQTFLYKLKYSTSWIGFPMALWVAAFCMFFSSALEGFDDPALTEQSLISNTTQYDSSNLSGSMVMLGDLDTLHLKKVTFFFLDRRILLTILNMIAIMILGIDMWMKHQLQDPDWHDAFGSLTQSSSSRLRKRSNSNASIGEFLDHEARKSRSERLIKPLILFCIVLVLENIARLVVKEEDAEENPNMNNSRNSFVLFSSIFKPLVLFYVSSQSRDALEAVFRIMKIVLRVLAMELLLILMFAAIACRLFPEYDSFGTLSTAWLSLFELATTVVNPSIWMPMYASNKSSALFFIVFVVTAVFYLHSLVLSVVFQTYVQSAGEIHERSAADREDAVHLAFASLLTLHQQVQSSADKADEGKQNSENNYSNGAIDIELVRETLKLVRPHYNGPKINALVEIVDPANQDSVDYTTFRTKIRQALNASIRTARNPTPLALSIELLAVAVAVINFVYVIMVSSPSVEFLWFRNVEANVGCAITAAAAMELTIRFNPFRIPDFTPLTRLNTTFDGLALLAAIVSCWGIILYILGFRDSHEWILMGRAIDMIRIMRFFQIFRDVVRRSSDVIPALLGPLVLVFTTVHIFCYFGMALWGGAVRVGAHVGELTELYDLNNFNSYQEGIVTMFNVLVVNDWHAIAEVFRFADRCSGAIIVYPFFVFSNLIGVSIMLNVLTAFFVESFVTKLNDDKDAPPEATATVHKERQPLSSSPRDFNIQLSDRDPIKRINTSLRNSDSKKSKGLKSGLKRDNDVDVDVDADADSEASSVSEMVEFDVYEREGFDKIMQTVTGSQYQVDYARQHSLERFGNRRFKTKSIGFLEEDELHVVVSNMHSELLALEPRESVQDRSIVRKFIHKRDTNKSLEVTAALLRRHPALSLFVSKTSTKATPAASPELPLTLENKRQKGKAKAQKNLKDQKQPQSSRSRGEKRDV